VAHSASIPSPSHAAGAAAARTRLEASRNAPALARRFTRDVLTGHEVDGEFLMQAELLVSELVTNAVVHARSPVWLSVSAGGGAARIEVEDYGGGRVARPQRGDLRGGTGGYGLWLVDSLADSWGVEYGGQRDGRHGRGQHRARETKRVWLDLRLPPGGPN
jgi:serine/threonine-protein kinase RsbW